MQYNHYHSSSHQAHPVSHPSQSPDDYPPSYPDPSHQHAALSYAAVTPATPLPAGSIGASLMSFSFISLIASLLTAHHNISPQYPYSAYPTHGTPDDHHSYYPTSSQGSAVNHYPAPSSPTTSYATPNPSGHISPQPSRHHPHLPQQQQQQQFIPTPSQTYQVFSAAGSASSARSRSTVEPYYHMSPNPQHVVHAPPASTTHGAGGRTSTAHGPGCSHSHHAHANTHTHTGTIVVAAGERYPCDLCDRSFTRLHDRRRHYETVHSTSPILHKCRFCRKDFSRSDSLKRHVDNGCDEMPR